MQPIHSLEYELTSAWATDVQRRLARWEWQRSRWRDGPQLAAALILGFLIIFAVLQGWMLPGVGGGLAALLTLFAIGAVFRRWAQSQGALATVLLALQTSDRRVRVEFADDRMRVETEFFRGEGAWNELDEVAVFNDFWVLYLTNGGRILLPTSSIKPELEAFLMTKAQQAAAHVHTLG
jgi:hypothetical protein